METGRNETSVHNPQGKIPPMAGEDETHEEIHRVTTEVASTVDLPNGHSCFYFCYML